ncbi:hypothetical protein PVAP13_6NG012300 [Panicum virgatum]|uniref:At1g61320/AtMIF1 LRR domain-containing protein n=1 Tax=Panicum virgatum TaxID=38727 RepID=A0A8T0QT36_PANVG|nr:hypothetical protein PVAP13_6NG012300 [Panicum virgatum]
MDEIQGSPSPCHEVDGGVSKDGETSGYSVPCLPEDIWRRIHSLMPMDAAARAACLSHAFLSSWRCYPNLTLTRKALCSKACGIGLKILRLNLCRQYNSFRHIDRWLQFAVTAGIEELTLFLDEHEEYKFPCSLLSVGVRSSIRSFELCSCVFRPTLELGPLRSLTRLKLTDHLDLTHCNEIIVLKIPSVLQQLSYLMVFGCRQLRVVENKAPSLSNFTFTGHFSKLSLGEASQTMKVLGLYHANVVYYARAKLASIMPNLETLFLHTNAEVYCRLAVVSYINSNTLLCWWIPTKFLNLKHLTIQIWSCSYDYFSLVSFLDASPSLVTWNLDVAQKDMKHESIFEGSSHLRQLPESRHDHLKRVEIIGFSSAKSLVELTCCIVKSAVSLEQLTLDTLHRCSGQNYSNGLALHTPCCPTVSYYYSK